MTSSVIDRFLERIPKLEHVRKTGRVTRKVGLVLESSGPQAPVGEIVKIQNLGQGEWLPGEVVGFRDGRVLIMPIGRLEGVAAGAEVRSTGEPLSVSVGTGLLGRVLDGLGRPIDGRGPLVAEDRYSIYRDPPHPLTRKRVTEVLPMGVKVIDGLITIGRGQRMGIFSGSGVGKSTLLGMVSRFAKADVVVIGLIGERGREVRDFLEKDLGEEGLSKAVVVVATSDSPPLVRLRGAFVATTIAEYFRDIGKNVLLLMDSVTRFARAQREVGLAIGEPPAQRGFTPSVFEILPKLLERSGNSDVGSITGIYTVLVDGDDFEEPICDNVRGILDGHIMLSRKLAERGQYPAVDVLKSLSRVMPEIVSDEQMKCWMKLKELLAVYEDAEDLINIGAYAEGSNPKIDESIRRRDAILRFLIQGTQEKEDFERTQATLKEIIS